jgi:hypothetical protein
MGGSFSAVFFARAEVRDGWLEPQIMKIPLCQLGELLRFEAFPCVRVKGRIRSGPIMAQQGRVVVQDSFSGTTVRE